MQKLNHFKIIHYIIHNISYHAETKSFQNNPLYHSKTHYIMKKLIVCIKNILYHAQTTSFLNNPLSLRHYSLYHAETHYIIQRLTI